MEDYGQVKFNGKTYRLTRDAAMDDSEAYQNDPNLFQMSAPAVLLDADGNDTDVTVKVYWLFEYQYRDDGSPAELDMYNYDDVDSVMVI